MVTSDLRRSVLRLVATQVCLHSAMTGFRMGAPLLALKLGQSPVAVGFLLALFALSQVFFALPAGRLADRYGLHVALRLAVFMASAALAASVLWPVFGVLCFSALVVGGASGLAVIALQRHAGRLAQGPTALREVFSWLAIGPSLSNLVGPLLVGVLIDWVSFQAAFLAMALLPWLAWWLVGHVAPEPNSTRSENALVVSSWAMFREPAFRRLMLINWLLSSCWDVHTFLVPVIGHEQGLSATVIGSLLASFAVAATLVRLLMPWMASRLQEGRVVGSAMLATAVLFVLYPLAESAWLMAGLSVLLGFALGSVQPMIMSTLHQITPHAQHGQALALRSMAINASSVLMPLVFGTVGTLVGVGVVFWAVAGVVGSGAPLAFSLRTPPPA
jgi:predicted MFS family arabinose efflux permease